MRDHGRVSRWARAAAGMGCGLVATALTTQPVAVAAPPGAEYVALGDSGAATTGVQHLDLTAPPLCARSTVNTPATIAEQLGLRLDDRTCSSARITHLTSAQGAGIAPQFEALGPATRLVTLHIGANDANFTRHVVACHLGTVAGRDCADAAWDAEIDAIAGDYAAALRQITALAPGAAIFVDGWPSYTDGRTCAAMLGLDTAGAARIQAAFDRLNGVVAAQARAAGATYVDTVAAARGHDMCAPPGVRWFEPVVADQTLVPYHPTVEGMRGVAEVVVAAVRASGFR
ncbi:SGNH/GDSL hydrolase family protein [Nocardia sp. NPDC004415]